MNDTVTFPTQQTIPSSDINISFAAFVKMIFVDDVLREWPLEDQVLTLLYSKMYQLTGSDPQNSLTYRDTFDKSPNFLLVFFQNTMSIRLLVSNDIVIESILSQQSHHFMIMNH